MLLIIIFSTLFTISFGLGAYTVIRYRRLILMGQKEEINTPFMEKIKSVFVNVLLQKKLFKKPLRGFFHVLIFYGFLIYGVHTTSQIIGGFMGDYYFYLPSLLGHSVEYVYDFILDIFSFAVLAGLVYFASRRWLLKAPELDRPSMQSFIILALIAFLMLFTLLGEPSKMIHLNQTDLNPIRSWIVDLIKAQGLESKAELLFLIGWWGHIGVVFLLTIYVPRSKHAHLIWAPLNFFEIRNTPKGAIRFLDIENNSVWGATNIQDFSWKSMIDGMSCIECGRCALVCPANKTGKLLNPKEIMTDIKHAFMDNMPEYANLKKQGSTDEELTSNNNLRVIDNYTKYESLWACTTCYACVDACPVGNNQVDSIMEMRRALVLNEGKLPSELQGALTNIENQSNPWGVGAHKREEWTEGLDIKTMSQWKELGDKPDVLFWVGCAGAFDDRNKKIVQSFSKVMQKAGIKFGILGNEENCSGDSARRAGNEYLFQTLAQTNIDNFNKYEVKNIVTTCPHCFNTIQNEYPQLGGNYKVEHHSTFLDNLLKSKQIEIDENKIQDASQMTYHDSCYLGRYNDNYSSPRNIVQQASGNKLVEPVDNKSNGLCCGAGGAQMWKEEESGTERVNIKRSKQLLDTGAKTVTTACPFCITMVKDGITSETEENNVEVKDISEVLEASIR